MVDMYKVTPPIRKEDYWEASRYRSLSGELSVVAATAWPGYNRRDIRLAGASNMPWTVRIEADFRGAGHWDEIQRIQIEDETSVPFVTADVLALLKGYDPDRSVCPLTIWNAILVMYGLRIRSLQIISLRTITKRSLAHRLKQYPWPLGDQASMVLEMEGAGAPV